MVRKSNTGYINGSTVFAPEAIPSSPIRKEEYEKLQRAKIEKLNREKQRKNAQKRKVLAAISVVFIVGLGLIWSEAQVYNSQNELSKIKKEIKELNLQNDDLKIQLVKVAGIDNIKKNAENNLKMISPDRKNVIYADLSKNNFAREPKDDRESKAKDVLTKIKNLLF